MTSTDEHTILGASNQPVCVVLSNHNFSPYVPAGRGESCMLVIRAEDGLLADLENIFRDVFRNFRKPVDSLPQGSVVLLGSTCHCWGWQPKLRTMSGVAAIRSTCLVQPSLSVCLSRFPCLESAPLIQSGTWLTWTHGSCP